MQFTKFFSTDSAKAIKAEKFGYLNAINYMAPHSTGGAGNLCPHSSAGCRSLCLGMYSGQAAMVSDLEHGTNAVRESRIAKSKWFMTDRAARNTTCGTWTRRPSSSGWIPRAARQSATPRGSWSAGHMGIER
jgi:hypothetical protein